MTQMQMPRDPMQPGGDAPAGMSLAVKFLLVLLAAGSFVAALFLLKNRGNDGPSPQGSVAVPGNSGGAAPAGGTGSDTLTDGKVEIGIAYGTEKQGWLTWAAEEFTKTSAGRNVKLNLKPMGSLDGARAVLKEDAAAKDIHVWSPASSLYKDIFVTEWGANHANANPIAREEPLALTPMVFTFWEQRYEPFAKKYGGASFQTIGQALAERGGWDAIAGQAEWGVFKFGHTHPNTSNSGLMTLVLMAYDYHHKSSNLQLKDILDVKFQQWMSEVERGCSSQVASTGSLMKDMVLKGPSTYDCIFVYENVAIERLKNAEGRWGRLKLAYPKLNMWSDNPYYVLDVPWSSPQQRQAAGAFLDFLLSESVQRQSLVVHGFRPANDKVALNFPESPFVAYKDSGLSIDLNAVCQPPKADVINNLLLAWQRGVGR